MRGFGLKASGGKRAWATSEGNTVQDASADTGGFGSRDQLSAEESNKLYVGLLIMLIFSEALAL